MVDGGRGIGGLDLLGIKRKLDKSSPRTEGLFSRTFYTSAQVCLPRLLLRL